MHLQYCLSFAQGKPFIMEYSARALCVIAMVLSLRLLPLARSVAIGVNYGLNGDNLPSPGDVINLVDRCGISFIRIFEPRHEVLEALRGKPNLLYMGTRNEDIPNLASSQDAANQWIAANVVPYQDVNIGVITVGSEVIPGPLAPQVAQAISNLFQAISNAGISKDIKVTTALPMTVMATSYPPSAGQFNDEVAQIMKDIASVTSQHGAPVLFNVYPYYDYVLDPDHISLDYALFRSQDPVVVDGSYSYYNLFDAMVDAVYAAFEKIGEPNVQIGIAETGWPSAGYEPYTSVENAQTYNKNFLDRMQKGSGTPRRPDGQFDVCMFEMFNEDQKSGPIEQSFGFFFPDMQPVYPLWQCQ